MAGVGHFWILIVAIVGLGVSSQAQEIKSSIDSTSIKIGQQITYRIEVTTDSTDLVVFPEGQTFNPLEMIESYPVDTTKRDTRFELIKKYWLTQFDSGNYTIPRQKILIGDQTFTTDSMTVRVNTVAVDTTKQQLYDIKPAFEVEETPSNWWKYALVILAAIALATFLIYWFIWRKKPLTEEEEIALLPPYDRAKLALQKLDETGYLQNAEIKDYYSELTFIIRRYLDEKVYDRALESTTDELVARLKLLREGNQIDLSDKDIRNIESILKRADLVKFAKSKPDIELAKMDRDTIDIEIDQVKQALPEPTEEEKLLDQQYREEQERKKFRRKIWLTAIVSVLLLIFTFIGFGMKYGFGYVVDTIMGNDSKELLEGEWVDSAYGVPPVYISTPEVLQRVEGGAIDSMQQSKPTVFSYGDWDSAFNININVRKLPQAPPAPAPGAQPQQQQASPQVDLNAFVDEVLERFEDNGVENIVVKREKFTTPNAAEGLKVFGTAKFPIPNDDDLRDGEYTFVVFSSGNVVQLVILAWDSEDVYAVQTIERILNSIEVKKVDN